MAIQEVRYRGPQGGVIELSPRPSLLSPDPSFHSSVVTGVYPETNVQRSFRYARFRDIHAPVVVDLNLQLMRVAEGNGIVLRGVLRGREAIVSADLKHPRALHNLLEGNRPITAPIGENYQPPVAFEVRRSEDGRGIVVHLSKPDEPKRELKSIGKLMSKARAEHRAYTRHFHAEAKKVVKFFKRNTPKGFASFESRSHVRI